MGRHARNALLVNTERAGGQTNERVERETNELAAVADGWLDGRSVG